MSEQMDHDTEDLTEAEFVARFTAHCLRTCGFTHFDDGTSVADHCADVAPSYWADPFQRETGPEECADADMDFWGEE
jgi:hypothetical protein